ncbi:MAG TPA: cytochrome-c oxidase [Casimicrobiaceae bacterium]|nr:cytochrome-c oxidase [Casimicrobiaceae bacterium]
MGLTFLKIAVVYLFVGVALGMGIAQNFALVPVHAHLLLLGWASLALAGLVYHLYPAAATTRLARAHFWLHNLGLPAFMLTLGLYLLGREPLVPVVAGSAIVVLVGLGVFAVNVLVNARAPS